MTLLARERHVSWQKAITRTYTIGYYALYSNYCIDISFLYLEFKAGMYIVTILLVLFTEHSLKSWSKYAISGYSFVKNELQTETSRS